MIDRSNGIIKLIEESKTHNEICSIFNLSSQELNYQLDYIEKNNGLRYLQLFRSDGEIIYTLDRSLFQPKKSINSSVYTGKAEDSLKTIFISDIHIGNSLMRPDLLNNVYKYCEKNNIHLIFCTGDILDGTFSSGHQLIKEPLKQIEYFLESIPTYKNILFYGIGGDHDASVKKTYGIDFKSFVRYRRPDVKIVSYGNATVRLKNDMIALCHSGLENENRKFNIKFVGHYHKYFIKQDENKIVVGVPTLSDIHDSFEPSGALEVQFDFSNKMINHIHIKQLNFKKCAKVLSENDIYIDTLDSNEIITSNEYDNEKKLVKKASI